MVEASWLLGKQGLVRYAATPGLEAAPFSFRPDFVESVCRIDDAFFGEARLQDCRCVWALPVRRRMGQREGYMPSLCFQLGPLFLEGERGGPLPAEDLKWKAADLFGVLADSLPVGSVDATLSYLSSNDPSIYAGVGFEVLARVSHDIADHATWKPSKQYRRVKPGAADIRVERMGRVDDHLWRLVQRTFVRRGGPIPYERTVLQAVVGLPGTTLLQGWKGNHLCAAALFGHDSHRTYYLVGVQDYAHPDSGTAATLVMKAGIDHAAANGLIFDFEGSMIAGVSQYFKQWGGQPRHLLRLRRRSRLQTLVQAARQALRGR